ncbi:MAG: hypothetical protein PIR02_07335 [Microbacterium enclense]
MTEVAAGDAARTRRVWPAQPELLTDTSRCPWCFAPITASPCATCGFDLSDPRTFGVLSLSQHIAGLVQERDEVLRQIRASAAAWTGPVPASGPAPVAGSGAGASASAASVGPVDPAESGVPVEPGVSGEPADAGARAVPAEPAVPAVAADPAGPVAHDEPGGPVAPDAPAEVGGPVVPAASVEPVSAAANAVVTPTFTAPPGFAPPGELHPSVRQGAPSTAAPGTQGGPAAGAPGTPTSPPAPQPGKPRRSGVQVFLLSVGVVLLAVAAAFFLTVAWVSGGLVLRSIIVGAVTAAVIVTASILRRRRLTATAEGIALLGIAFVALDVWAVRANDLAGAAGVDARVYWGWAALLAGVGFVAWARLAGLRAPLSAGIAALAVGPPLIAAGLFGGDTTLEVYAAGLTALVLTLASSLVPRLARADVGSVAVEITALRVFGGVGALMALIAALVLDPDRAWAPLAASAPIALLLAAHAAVLVRTGAEKVAPIASPFAVMALGAGVAATVARVADTTIAVTVPLLVAVVIALALEAVSARLAAGASRTTVVVAALTAAIGAGLAAVVPVAWALSALAEPLRRLVPLFGDSAFAVNDVDATSTAAAITLVAAVVLAAVVWRLTGRATSRRLAVLWSAAIVMLLIGPQLRVVVGIVLWYVAMAVAGVVLLRRRRGDVAVASVVGSLALLAGWFLSFPSPLAWTLATLGVLVVVWMLASVTPAARVPAAVSFVVFAAGSAWLAPAAAERGLGVDVVGFGPLEAGAFTAVICLVVALLPWRGALAPPRGLDRPQREAAALAALAIAFLSSLVHAVLRSGDGPVSVWWAAIGVVTTAAAAWVALGSANRSWAVLRPAAAVTWSLLGAMAALAVVRPLTDGELAPSTAVSAVALVAAALGVSVLRREVIPRVLSDAGTAVAALVAVTVLAPRGDVWIPLLIVAVTTLIWAVDTDGLFVSRGPRRHLVWLALALATSALWLQLFSARVETVEVYTLPVAVALILLAAANERARRRVADRSVAAPAVIAFAGVALALVPTAVADVDDTVRVLVATGLGVVFLLAGAWARPPRTPDLLPLAVAAAGALALVVAGGARLVHVAQRGESGGPLVDALVVVSAVALGAAALGCVRRTASWAPSVGRATAIAAAVVFVVGETVLIAVDGGPVVRAVLAVVALGAVGAFASRGSHALTGVPIAAVLLGGAALVALVGLGAGVRPVEWMTVPLAAALLATTVVVRTRSAPPLVVGLATVGLAVALLPSAALVADELPRAIAVLTVSVALLVAASLVSHESVRPLRLPALGVAALSLVIAGGVRALGDLDRPLFDAWALAVVVPLVAAGVLLQRRRDGLPAVTATAAVLTGLTVAAVLSSVRLATVGDESLRAALTIVVLLAVGLLWRGSQGSLVFWAGVGLGGVVGATALATGSADPVEFVTTPLAVALVLHGVRSLRRNPALRSWPALGVALALLLLPSLVFDFADDNVLWRVIALGVVALAVLLAGARYKLQAPVLLGGIVLIVHAVAQLWPWIASIYESVSGLWWLWLGIAGVLLIVVAATYERRIREVKAVALAIRALR